MWAIFEWLQTLLTYAACGALCLMLAVFWFQNKLLYVPSIGAQAPRALHITPLQFGWSGAALDELYIATSDGVKLHAYWFSASKNSERRSAVLTSDLHNINELLCTKKMEKIKKNKKKIKKN